MLLALQQRNIGITAGLDNLFRPHAGLDFAHMGFPEEVNAHAALADTAADGLGQFAGKKGFLEGQLSPLLAAADLQLFPEGVRIHADTHGGDLQGDIEQGIVKQDVAVQAPVVIVRGAAVMGLAAAQRAADLHEEYGAVFLCGDVFAFFGGLVRILILQLLGGNEGDGVRQFGLDMGIVCADKTFSLAEGQVDPVDDVPQELLIPFGGAMMRSQSHWSTKMEWILSVSSSRRMAFISV